MADGEEGEGGGGGGGETCAIAREKVSARMRLVRSILAAIPLSRSMIRLWMIQTNDRCHDALDTKSPFRAALLDTNWPLEQL